MHCVPAFIKFDHLKVNGDADQLLRVLRQCVDTLQIYRIAIYFIPSAFAVTVSPTVLLFQNSTCCDFCISALHAKKSLLLLTLDVQYCTVLHFVLYSTVYRRYLQGAFCHTGLLHNLLSTYDTTLTMKVLQPLFDPHL